MARLKKIPAAEPAPKKPILAKSAALPVAKGAIGAAVGIVFVLAVVSYLQMPLGGSTPQQIDKAVVAVKCLDYINQYFLSPQGLSASLVRAEDYSDSLYAIYFDIMSGSSKLQETTVYVTKDGRKMLAGDVFDLDTPFEIPQPAQDDNSGADGGNAGAIAKTDKPNVKMFVMSFCPYGQQAEAGLLPVYALLGDAIEFEPHFVVYSNYATRIGKEWQDYCYDEAETYCTMHGIAELMEDVRQLCIWRDAREKWVDYVSGINSTCSSNDVETCWEGVAASAGVDIEKTKTCAADEAAELLAAEKLLNETYGVGGSPYVLINDSEYSGQRTPEAYKAAVCSAFNTPPAECETELSSEGGTAAGGCN